VTELREVGEPGVADALLVRHLVTHTTGLDAAAMVADVGEGDGAIAAARLAERRLIQPSATKLAA
jgi:hypothetical protein